MTDDYEKRARELLFSLFPAAQMDVGSYADELTQIVSALRAERVRGLREAAAICSELVDQTRALALKGAYRVARSQIDARADAIERGEG